MVEDSSSDAKRRADRRAFQTDLDCRISQSRQRLIDGLDREIAVMRGELIHLHNARHPGILKPRELIARTLRSRVKRAQIFPRDLFAEPAWDMLLTLALARLDDRKIALKEAMLGSGVPATTALRWLGLLESHNLVAREPDPVDRRRVFLMLTDDGWNAMKAWIESAP